MRTTSGRSGDGMAEAGFSLVEIMVVIGILLLLAGLMTPIVERVRERSKSIQCVNHLRQWGMGFSLYLDEHRGVFPGDGTEGGNEAPELGRADAWYNAVAPYVNLERYADLEARGLVPCPGAGKNLFICPSSPIENELASRYASSTQKEFYCSYAMNHWLFNSTRDGELIPQRMRLSLVRKPAVFVVLSESPDGRVAKIHPTSMLGEKKDMTGYRHRDAANALFADWHVEPLLKKVVLTPGMALSDNGGGIQWNPERDEANARLD